MCEYRLPDDNRKCRNCGHWEEKAQSLGSCDVLGIDTDGSEICGGFTPRSAVSLRPQEGDR